MLQGEILLQFSEAFSHPTYFFQVNGLLELTHLNVTPEKTNYIDQQLKKKFIHMPHGQSVEDPTELQTTRGDCCVINNSNYYSVVNQ